MPRKLWQWHNVSATDDAGIIQIARDHALWRYANAVAMVAAGPTKITTIEDAIEYLESNELGSVQEYDVVELGDDKVTE